jgi:hypothetical protein
MRRKMKKRIKRKQMLNSKIKFIKNKVDILVDISLIFYTL